MSNNNGFAIADIATGQLNALVKNLMRGMEIDDPVEAVRRMNSREWLPFKPANFWRENGLIYFAVVSHGMTPSNWIDTFNNRGFNVDIPAKKAILSMEPTKDVVTKIVVCEKADDIRQRLNKKISVEAACLIRLMFSDQDLKNMGLFSILAFHANSQNLLSINRRGIGKWLGFDYLEIKDEPGRGVAFAV